ncbi:CS domain protein, putative [Hepatocystis sp. ex Piliocolobus tephrosceles]|nr:CS domain protein, putative [Hepatocystis sp. ex Piliocolobus tephrosceles]
MEKSEKHESMLMAIIRDFNSIDDLIEMFVSFLERKTDYFHIMISDNDIKTLHEKYNGEIAKDILNNNNRGFRPNNREQALIKLFRKHQLNYLIKKQPYLIENENMKNKYLPQCDEVKKLKNFTITDVKNVKNNNIKNSETITTPLNSTAIDKHISIWNGGHTEKYFWNQTLNEINMEIPMNTEIKAKDIQIEITNNYIKVQHLDKLILSGQFYDEVCKQSSMWNIEDKKKIIIFLEKKKENWWPSVIKGDKEIDTSKIESKKNLTDFDQKTQGEIIKFLQEQKLKNEALKLSEEPKEQLFMNNIIHNKGSPP